MTAKRSDPMTAKPSDPHHLTPCVLSPARYRNLNFIDVPLFFDFYDFYDFYEFYDFYDFYNFEDFL
jgi:hypothetical protein